MSTQLAETPPPQHPVAAHLKECGIERVLLIDDAFDPFDVVELQQDIGELWDRVTRNDDLKRDLASVRPNIEDRSQIDLDLINALFEKRGELPHLGPVCAETLFADKLSKLSDLRPLRSHFEDLGIPVLEVGSDQPLPEEQCRLIFLDYSLGPDETVGAVANARARAEEIYRVGGDDEKPFIVLMSSKPNAELAQQDFRERSGLLGGLFAFLTKTEFTNREKFNLHLASWALGMPTRHAIQRFVEALDKSAKAAAAAFSKRVRALGVEDYANIQHLSLQPDGHPLGDYLLWLYKSLFAHLLHDNADVLAEQKKLDALAFEEFTPSQSAPSVDLADIYRCALTEPGVGPLAPHPRAEAGNTQPYLQLGDMFFKLGGAKEVLIVLSAACDLAYAPGAAREFPANQFVLLEYGELQSIAELPTESAMRTELFLFDSAVYRILWNHRRAVWKEYGTIEQWLTTEGFVRRARLSLPYALELQKSFANHISRIGMPVKPPLFMKADVDVVAEGDDGNCRVIATIRNGAQVIRRRNEEDKKDEEMFALTVDCVGQIVASLQQVYERLNAGAAAIISQIESLKQSEDPAKDKKLKPLDGQRQGLAGKIAKVNSLTEAYPQWTPLIQKLQLLPEVGGKNEVDRQLFWVFRNAAALVEGRYNFGPPIVLHLKTSYPAAVPAQPTGVMAEQAAVTAEPVAGAAAPISEATQPTAAVAETTAAVAENTAPAAEPATRTAQEQEAKPNE